MSEKVGSAYLLVEPKLKDGFEADAASKGGAAGKSFGGKFGDMANTACSSGAVALGNIIANVISSSAKQIEQFVADTIKVGSTFEASMSNVAALSGATGDDLEMLTETAERFGSTTQFSASQAADALGYMALAGWDANASADALGGVLDLAAASGMDLAAASDMVTDYLSAFGMGAEQSAYFANLLAYAQANSNTSAAQLGQAYKNCAANMHAAGQDIETVTSLLAMMANQGLKGSEAGTALTATMRDITNSMEDGQIMIGDAAVAVMDAEGNFRDLTEILADVAAATDGMGDAQRAAALSSTFTADSQKALNLILAAGVGDAASFEEQLRDCGDAASEMSRIMNDNLAGDLKTFDSALEGLQITLFKAVAPALRLFAQVASGALSGVNEAFKAMGEAVMSVLSPVTEFVEGAVVPAAERAAEVIVPIVNDIGGVVDDVMTASYDVVGSVMDGVMGTIGDSWPYIQDVVELALGTIQRVSAAVWPAVSGFVKSAGGAIKAIVDAVFPVIRIVVSTVFAGIQATAENVWPAVSGIVETAASVISGVISGLTVLVDIIAGTFDGIRTAIEGPINAARDIVRGAIEAIKGFFRFEISWPHIPVPHFYISPAGWGIGDLLKGSIPSLGIDWYAQGGIVDEPTLVGAGEAGREAIVPLTEPNIAPFADAVASRIGVGGITINEMTVVTPGPEDFMRQLTAFAARTRAQYA